MMDEPTQDGRLIELRLAQIDKHLKILEAEALEAKASKPPATASEPAKTVETKAQPSEVTCGHDAPKIVTNTPYKKYNDRTIYSNALSK